MNIKYFIIITLVIGLFCNTGFLFAEKVLDTEPPVIKNIEFENDFISDIQLDQNITVIYDEKLDSNSEPRLILESEKDLSYKYGFRFKEDNVIEFKIRFEDSNIKTSEVKLILENVKDLSGNFQKPFEKEVPFIIDFENPVVELKTNIDFVNSNNRKIDFLLEFNEDMNTSKIPNINIKDLSHSDYEIDKGSWSSDSKAFKFSIKFNNDISEGLIDILISNVSDIYGNNIENGDFEEILKIDTQAPILDIYPQYKAYPVFNDSEIQKVNFVFSKDINKESLPDIEISNLDSYYEKKCNWGNELEPKYEYLGNSENVYVCDFYFKNKDNSIKQEINFEVNEVYDLSGNSMMETSYKGVFILDYYSPLYKVEISSNFISPFGNPNNKISLYFNRKMNRDIIDPLFSFNNSVDFNISSCVWTKTPVRLDCVFNFPISENSFTEEFLDLRIGKICDSENRCTGPKTIEDAFFYDGVFPEFDINFLKEKVNDSLYQEINFQFNEPMNTNEIPNLNIEGLDFFYQPIGYWVDEFNYFVDFNINDNSEFNKEAVLVLSGALDKANNKNQNDKVYMFKVDTSNAVSEIEFELSTLDSTNLTQTITTTFNKDMNTQVVPTFEVSGLEDTYAEFTDQNWLDSRTFVMNLTINDDDEENTATVTLVSAVDSVGNLAQTTSNTFFVDTSNGRGRRLTPLVTPEVQEEPVEEETNVVEEEPIDNEENSDAEANNDAGANLEEDNEPGIIDELEPVRDETDNAPLTGLVTGASGSKTKNIANGVLLSLGLFSVGLGGYKLFLLKK